MNQFTLWDIVRNLLYAVPWTLLLSAIAFAGGGIVALILLVIGLGRSKTVWLAVKLYVELFQSTPLLMQLFLVYFGLPLLGIDVSAWLAAATCLTLYSSAFLTDIWRGSVVGRQCQPRPALPVTIAFDHPAASHAHGHTAYCWISGATCQKHGAGFNCGLPRIDENSPDTDQCHLPALRDFWPGCTAVFPDLLSSHALVTRA
jgi:His/Glu/Gln/Arg/opine family amino acid ABC transporter permease subunit